VQPESSRTFTTCNPRNLDFPIFDYCIHAVGQVSATRFTATAWPRGRSGGAARQQAERSAAPRRRAGAPRRTALNAPRWAHGLRRPFGVRRGVGRRTRRAANDAQCPASRSAEEVARERRREYRGEEGEVGDTVREARGGIGGTAGSRRRAVSRRIDSLRNSRRLPPFFYSQIKFCSILPCRRCKVPVRNFCSAQK